MAHSSSNLMPTSRANNIAGTYFIVPGTAIFRTLDEGGEKSPAHCVQRPCPTLTGICPEAKAVQSVVQGSDRV